MDAPDLSDFEAEVLRAVQAEGSVDIYDLAQAVGTGPRAVQEAVGALDEHRLVLVTDRGRQVRCTPAGDDLARKMISQVGDEASRRDSGQ